MSTRFLIVWAAAVLIVALAVTLVPGLLSRFDPEEEPQACAFASYAATRDLPAAWWLRRGDLKLASGLGKTCASAYEGLYVRRALNSGEAVDLAALRPAPEIRGAGFTIFALDAQAASALNAGGTAALFNGPQACYNVPVLAVWKKANEFEGALAAAPIAACKPVLQGKPRVVPQLLEAEAKPR